MGRFSKAFEQGQTAAESAAVANVELDKIFAEMASELRQASNGKLLMTIESPSAFLNMIATTITLLSGNPSTEPSQDFWICAQNPTAADSKPIRLAGFRRPYEGFPCSIQYGNDEVRCNDAIAFAAALDAMLKNAWVASELHKIVNRPPKAEPGANAASPKI